MAILKFRTISTLAGYEGPFSEMIEKWKTLFTAAHISYGTLVRSLPNTTIAFTKIVRAWEDNQCTILTKGTTDYNDLNENLNDFLSETFYVHLYVIKAWCSGNDDHQDCAQILENMWVCISGLRKIPQYFLTHEFNAIVGSFRNEQDYCPVDFLFDGKGDPYTVVGFTERFTESRLATFYLTAYLTVKFPTITDWKEEFFESFFTTTGKSLTAHTYADNGQTFPTIVYATEMAKEHLKKV